MGRRARQKPQHLGAKLLAIRRKFGVSQFEFAKLLGDQAPHSRLSEFESGKREPNLLVLLAYARLAGISTDVLIDDAQEIAPTEKQ